MAWISEAQLKAHFMKSLALLVYTLAHGADVSPETRVPLRASFREVIHAPVLLDSLRRLNHGVPPSALEDAARRVTDGVFTSDLVQEKRRLHGLMVHGVPGTFLRDREERNARV